MVKQGKRLSQESVPQNIDDVTLNWAKDLQKTVVQPHLYKYKC